MGRPLSPLVLLVTRGVVAVVAVVAVVVALASGCRREPGRIEALVDASGRHEARALPAGVRALDALFDGRVRLLGISNEGANVVTGANTHVVLYWLVERELAGAAPMVFVHVAAPGAEVNQASADHKLPALEAARPGDVVVDAFDVVVPASIAVDELLVWAGLFEGKDRWQVTPAAVNDGKDRVEVARLHVPGAPAFLVEAEVHKKTAPIAVDGVLDEPDWARAAVLGPFASWDGKTVIERKTTAKLLWDDDNLYVAFIGDDPDVFTPYQKHDDPLYDSEAVEIFIDADGDKDVYVELQAAPANDLHFDAAFAGGRRKNMDTSYDPHFESKSVVDVAKGTFVSEWRIPVRELKDVPARDPKVGAVWKVNLFRLERIRDASKTRVVKNEASAWSSPLSGDFHNLDRFGAITFVE